jgi:polyhydroxyalkanoate synthase subunit PhaC
MILQTETVEQAIEGGERARFVKDVVATREGAHPIAMVRKRLYGLPRPLAPVLLVHGFGQNRYTWHSSKRSFVNYLASAGFDVFNLDLRGRGRSRRYGAQEDRLIDDYIIEDVPAAVRTALRMSGRSQVFLVGHSMGGLISYSVAGSSLRSEVAGVVTLGSPYRFGEGSLFLRSVFAPLFYGVRYTGMFDANPLIPMGLLGKLLGKARWLSDNPRIPMPLRPWAPGSMEPEVLEENLRSAYEHTKMAVALGIVGGGRENALRSHDGLTDYGLAFELTDKPLLVVAGTRDALAPPASVKPAFDRSRSSDKTYREFTCGHIDMVLGKDAPVTVWPAVRTWLEARARRVMGETSERASARPAG